jgi:DNA-directed RNA polymerase sigma subunit (sigma70/sigma32)
VANRLNVTRERLRQIEEAAIAKLVAAGVPIEELGKC